MPVAGGCGSAPAAPKETETASRREWRLPEGVEWTPVVLLLAAIGMAFRPSKKKTGVMEQPLPQPASYVPTPLTPHISGVMGSRPALRGIAGEYAGKAFSLEGGPSVLGRDQRAANLVFASSESISKRHCTVSWDAARKTFVLEDLGSTNGTFLSTGERLMKGQPRDLAAGARFFIGDLRNQFEVRMD
jgi:pSer/pThr/pTyr-binding forkhead associated (FHA) protein